MSILGRNIRTMEFKPSRTLTDYRPYWAECFGVAPFLPTSREEMDALGWDSCDVIIITGDAYVDHPSFGMAVIGRVLEAHGFRVGIIAQPNWQDTSDFMRLGRPNLYFGVAAGNMDSMINRYTADKKIRRDDAYTPDNVGGKRPDRAVIVYSQRCREAFAGVPIVIGSIEASLRRIAHYDYWSEKVRRSILFDAKADMLLYGNAERAIVELSHRMGSGEPIEAVRDIRGTAFILKTRPKGFRIVDESHLPEDREKAVRLIDDDAPSYIELPGYKEVCEDSDLYAHASRILHRETNPHNARPLLQPHGDRLLWLNPPPEPLTTEELDWVFEQPFQRIPHPSYGEARIPAYEMIRHSINIMRGCFGGCTFCSITEHEGRIIQSRSEESILNEIKKIRDEVPGFTGTISDLGGPTANMYKLNCKSASIQKSCRRLSCVYPTICKHLNTDHSSTTQLYRKARKIKGVKRIAIASGLRYDLALKDHEYIKELVTHHVGGYLKIAPEHSEEKTLSKMMKPSISSYDEFKILFDKYSKEADKEQYLIPYFIAAHPGCDEEDMLNLSLWLKHHKFKPDQVQTFYPSPMALATAMYYSQKNPLEKVRYKGEKLKVCKDIDNRRLQKSFLRYHDEANWPILRKSLLSLGRADLIGNGPQHLIPPSKPKTYRSSRIIKR